MQDPDRSQLSPVLPLPAPPPALEMASLLPMQEENRLLQQELSRLEDLLAQSRAERDELAIKYTAVSERVGASWLGTGLEEKYRAGRILGQGGPWHQGDLGSDCSPLGAGFRSGVALVWGCCLISEVIR